MEHLWYSCCKCKTISLIGDNRNFLAPGTIHRSAMSEQGSIKEVEMIEWRLKQSKRLWEIIRGHGDE